MTGLDWGILALAALMAVWGYEQGLVVGALTLTGFALGAALGAHFGPALLPEGSRSPYAPAMALLGGLLLGGLAAVPIEGLAWRLRARFVRGGIGRRLDGWGGAVLIAALGLALAWLFGAVALNAPAAAGLRSAVQRSLILRRLNQVLPPASVLDALHRIDPRLALSGPPARVGPPDPRIARDPEVARAGQSVVRVLGTACGLGVEGSGWVVRPGLVVTAAHVVAGEGDTTVTPPGGSPLAATAVHYDPSNDLALLRVGGLGAPPLPLSQSPSAGTSGAVLGYPENGPFAVAPARLGATASTVSEDSYGRGPVNRLIASLRGTVRSGDSGGPMVDGEGRVLTTVFASTTSGRPGGFGVPDSIVARALGSAGGPVGTGPCSR